MSQKIIDGIEGINRILTGKKVFLVCGSSYDFLNVKNLINAFVCVRFSDFSPNPLYEQVVKGVELFNKSCCDTIVAVGGGSAIDVAKCIKLFCKMDSTMNYLEQERCDTFVPLVAIPTTAGTGSESTKYAVIYYQGVKLSVFHVSIIPNYAVLEPLVLKKLPLYQKKCTMFDALCQAIESWWSVNSTDESVGYSQWAIQAICNHWKGYIVDNDEESATAIMRAANYAGRAINITATTAAHAMSYRITSMYKIPHGHAVAMCMLEVWQYIIDNTDKCIDARGKEYLQKKMEDISELIDINYFKTLFTKLDLGYPISANRLSEIDVLVDSVNPERLSNNPVELSKKVLRDMYERIVKENEG